MRRVPRSRRSPVPLVSSLHSFLCLSLRSDPVGNRGEECNVGERRHETKGEGPVAARKGEDDNKRAEIHPSQER